MFVSAKGPNPLSAWTKTDSPVVNGDCPPISINAKHIFSNGTITVKHLNSKKKTAIITVIIKSNAHYKIATNDAQIKIGLPIGVTYVRSTVFPKKKFTNKEPDQRGSNLYWPDVRIPAKGSPLIIHLKV